MSNRDKLPKMIEILGVPYQITFTDNPAEVDVFMRQSLWGQVDYWTRTIRVYDNGRPLTDLWQTLLHEILHAIVCELHIDILEWDSNDKTKDNAIDLLAMGLMNVLFRNNLLVVPEEGN